MMPWRRPHERDGSASQCHVPLAHPATAGAKDDCPARREGPITPRSPARADPAMVKALARAFRWKRLLDDGRYASISEIATAEKIDRGYVGSILRLTLLAPDIVEAILDGRQPDGLGLPALLEPFPIEWDQQRSNWFGAVAGSGKSSAGTRTSDAVTAPNSSLLATEDHRRRRPKRRTSVAEARSAVP